jgi:CRISPR/Cas system-associated exonuclease Cas4 (RecB family)
MKQPSAILGPKRSYTDMLDEGTKKKLLEKRGKYNPLRPSASGKCTKELGYEYAHFKGYKEYPPEAFEPRVHRIFGKGHSLEYFMIRQFKEAFEQVPEEMEMRYKQQVVSIFTTPDGLRVEGSIDHTFVLENTGGLIDYKTKGDKFSSWAKSKWDEENEKLSKNKYVQEFGDQAYYIEDLKGFLETLNDPFLAMNFYQLNLYFFDENRFLRDRGINHAALIYLNKNDSRVREIRFKPSEDVFKQIKDKLTLVHRTVERDKHPENLPRDYNLGSAKCAFCSYSKQCHPNQNTLKEYFKTFPDKKWPKDTSYMGRAVREELETVYEAYKQADEECKNKDKIEQRLINLLDKCKVAKVRFGDGAIYELRALKTGGVKGGPRVVLRRGKL